jgi:hypothetical protein
MATMDTRRFPDSVRFFLKVDTNAPGGCWRWTGAHFTDGYGMAWVGGKFVRAHRYAYQLLREPTEESLDHLCRVIDCVNPDHLEPCSRSENRLRAAVLVTHCKRGHPLPERKPGSHQRVCNACYRIRYHARKN